MDLNVPHPHRQSGFWFFMLRFVLPVSEFHINGIIKYVFRFCAQHNVFEIHPGGAWINNAFFLFLLNSNPSYGYALVVLFCLLVLYPFVDGYLHCFHFWQLWIRQLWIFLCKYFCWHMSLFPLGKYLGEELLSNWVGICLTVEETANFERL